MSRSKELRKNGRKKAAVGPKKPLSAYMCFARARRPEILKDRPDLKSKVTEVSKLIGVDWGKLTEAEKEKYVSEAEKDKARYEKEKAEFEQKKDAKSEESDD